jgi:hypothetical protein
LSLEGDVISKELGFGLARPHKLECDTTEPQELGFARGTRLRLLGFGRRCHTQGTWVLLILLLLLLLLLLELFILLLLLSLKKNIITIEEKP